MLPPNKAVPAPSLKEAIRANALRIGSRSQQCGFGKDAETHLAYRVQPEVMD
jgi:hypothetical protein